jgi:hypothetical protein
VVGAGGACALQVSGLVSCWGDGFWNQRTAETNYGICRADSVTPLTGQRRFPLVKRIALATDGRLCGVTDFGDTYCDGSWYSEHERFEGAANGQLLAAPGLQKISVPRARDVAAGEHHFCTIGVDGSVSCWGENGYGQCGGPTGDCVTHIYTGCPVSPQRVQLSEKATAVAAGNRHSCAILESAKVACWGHNDGGALGFRSEQRCRPYYRGFCDVVPGVVTSVAGALELTVSRASLRTWVRTESGSVTWPNLRDARIESRPLGETCSGSLSALSPEEAVRRESHLMGRRIHVRGKLSTMLVQDAPFEAMGGLIIHPLLLTPRPNGEIIVDGKLTRFRDASRPLGIWVYDVCRVSAPK